MPDKIADDPEKAVRELCRQLDLVLEHHPINHCLDALVNVAASIIGFNATSEADAETMCRMLGEGAWAFVQDNWTRLQLVRAHPVVVHGPGHG